MGAQKDRSAAPVAGTTQGSMTMPDQTTYQENTARIMVESLLIDYGYEDMYDPGDLWGTIMSTAFETCDEATRRGIPVPDELNYRPAWGGPEPLPEPCECGAGDQCNCEPMPDAANLPDDALIGLLDKLHPVIVACEMAGLAY